MCEKYHICNRLYPSSHPNFGSSNKLLIAYLWSYFPAIGSVMTPYYSEETVYSKTDLELENEDGVSILYYLQKIFPGEWLFYLLQLFCCNFSIGYSYHILKLDIRHFHLTDEWNNFMERINCKKDNEIWENEENILQLRHWVSLRGQTLCRTGIGWIPFSGFMLVFSFYCNN